MKKIMIAGLLLVSLGCFGQSNTAGNIQVGVNWGLLLGGAGGHFTNKALNYTENSNLAGGRFNVGVKGQYSFAEKFSTGIFFRHEIAGYVSVDANTNDYFSDYNLTLNANSFDVEAKYYPVNRNHFNLYLAPSFGFTLGKTNVSSNIDGYDANTGNYYSYNVDGNANGINYGFVTGFNWYWTDLIGMNVELGFNGSSLNGAFDNSKYKKLYDYKVNSLGIALGMGIVAKFGTTKQ